VDRSGQLSNSNPSHTCTSTHPHGYRTQCRSTPTAIGGGTRRRTRSRSACSPASPVNPVSQSSPDSRGSHGCSACPARRPSACLPERSDSGPRRNLARWRACSLAKCPSSHSRASSLGSPASARSPASWASLPSPVEPRTCPRSSTGGTRVWRAQPPGPQASASASSL
jgi:hypothetical protein